MLKVGNPVYRVLPLAPGNQSGCSWRHAFHRLPRDPVKGATYRTAYGLCARFIRFWISLFCVALCCAFGPMPPTNAVPARAPKGTNEVQRMAVIPGTKKPPLPVQTNAILFWNPYPGAGRYHVKSSNVATGPFILLAIVETNTFSTPITGPREFFTVESHK